MTKKKSKVKKESEFSGLSLDDLTDKKKEIKEFLASLENDYRNAVISEKSYKHTKEVNRKKMEDLKQQLEDFGITDSDDESENDSDKPSDDVKKETSETVPASPEPAQASQDAPPPSEQAQTPQNSEGAEKVEDVPPQSEPAQTPQGAESAEKVEDASTEDHKGSSFIDKLKQHMKPLTSSVSSEPAAPKTDAPSSNDTASKTTSSSQNVELLMQKFSEKINIDLERIKANIDSIKEAKSSTDEKLQSMTENLAELRTTVFQREAGLKEQELKFTKVKELVDDIEPEKINKQFMKRDKFMSEMEIRIEKLEVKMNDLIKTAKHTDDLLKSIGGLENVANINHDITKKMEHINEKGKSVDHIFSKIEKMFVDMNKNLDDFNIYQTRQDNMNDVLEDTLKNVDQLGVKFNSYIDKKDMKTMQNNMDALSEKIEVMMGILKKAVPFAEAEIPKDLQDLENQKEDIESLLSTLESEYKKKQISEIDYNKIKMKNEAYLDKIKEEISKIMKQIIKKESNGKSSKSETSETSENTETNDTTDKPTDTDKPADTTDKDSDNTDKSSDTTDKDSDDTDKPADNTDKDTDDTDKPTDTTDKDTDDTDKPADTTDKDSDDTDKSSDDADKDSDDTDKPADDTGKDTDDTDKSVDTTDKDTDDTDKSADDTGKDSDDNDKPDDNTDKDTDNTDKSADTTDKSSDDADKPVDDTDKDSDDTDKPADDTGKNIDNTDKSADDTEKTKADVDEPKNNSVEKGNKKEDGEDAVKEKTDETSKDNTSEDMNLLLEELEDSLAQGIISKETYDKTKKLITG